MRTIKKFSGALVVASMMASGVMISSTPVYAAGRGQAKKPTICSLLAAAYAAASTLPNSDLKTYILNYILAQEAANNCPVV